MSQSIIKNTIYKFMLSIFNIFIPVLIGPYINGLLNKEDFGVYNKSLSVVTFFLVFASFGIYQFGIREISKIRDDKEKVSKLFTNLFLFGVITNITVTFIYFIYILFFVNGSEQTIFFIMIIQIIANTFLVEWVNEAVEDYGFITKKTIIIRVISTLMIFLLVVDEQHTYIYAIITAITFMVNNLASYFHIKKSIPFNFSDFKIGSYIKPLSLLLIISNVNILFTQLDRIMLGQFVSDISVSEYAIPSNLMNMIILTMMSMITVSIPRLNYYINNNQSDNYMDLLNKSTKSYFFLVFPSCIGLFALSYEVMMLYGTVKYIDAYPVLMIFAIRFIPSCIITIFSNQIFYIYKKEVPLVLFLSIGGILNVIFNFVLVWVGIFTPSTAILTTGLAEIIMVLFMYYYIRVKMSVSFKLFAFYNMKYLYFSLPFIPIVYFVKMLPMGIIMTSVVSVLICVVYYFGVLFILKDKMLLLFIDKFLLTIRRK